MTLEVHYMEKLDVLYSDEYLLKTYFNKMCINCSNKCSNCTELDVSRFYVRYKGDDISTVKYKCNNYHLTYF